MAEGNGIDTFDRFNRAVRHPASGAATLLDDEETEPEEPAELSGLETWARRGDTKRFAALVEGWMTLARIEEKRHIESHAKMAYAKGVADAYEDILNKLKLIADTV